MTIPIEAIPVTQLNNSKEAQLIVNHLSSGRIGRFVNGFVSILAICDKATEEHTQRVTVGAIKLSHLIGIPRAELVQIKRGALLHDIGKIFVPYRILCKQEPLTEREMKILQKHPSYAYHLLRPFKHLQPALDIPYAHHERWDGTGYPRGLKGQQIPLSARIFSIIDVWDALCSDRPYRSAWSQEDASSYISEQAGILFDPDITRVFLRSINHPCFRYTPHILEIEEPVSLSS